ncbi:MAG: sulfate/molybdate ABC transporter ATP-binding protein [Bacillota bacterium]|nr:sulfate/molybdate ABC transporter ATP-binding protein [Bacillota bacterium]
MELLVDIENKLSGFCLNTKFKTGKDTLGLLGSSGSGKSMILRCIAGIETPTKGRIVLNGRELFNSDKKINLPIRKRKVAILFQNYALFPHMNVYENIAFGLSKVDKKENKKKINEKIEMMQLNGLEERYPSELSGGQQQRVALARALIIEPEALLLDEPFSALDNHLKSKVEKKLIESLSNYNGTSIFVTHNMDEIYRICRNIQVISQGTTVAYGDKEKIFNRPPNLTTAKLTGCKNFSKIKVISPYVVEAVDWGCKIHLNQKTTETEKYIGFRANHIVVADSIQNIKYYSKECNCNEVNCQEDIEKENIFDCWVVETSETPFRMTVYISLKENQDENSKFLIQWEVSKEKWFSIKDKPQPWKVYMNMEKLFLMEE